MKKLTALLLVFVLSLTSLTFADTGEGYRVGDVLTFGTYAGEPIEWQILEDMGDGTYVLLSVKGLDAMPYNDTFSSGMTWADCTLRAWLNGEFYETAFTAEEKDRIVLSRLVNPRNIRQDTSGGQDTEDRVYLLSLEETGRYFNVDPYNGEGVICSQALICMPTQTAINNGANYLDDAMYGLESRNYGYTLKRRACWWWLRSPGADHSYASLVSYCGLVTRYGNHVDNRMGCVRPVIRARLDGYVPSPAPGAAGTAYSFGDTVSLGTYAGEPIEWQVLEDMGDGTCVLLSVKGLAALPYCADPGTGTDWESCTLRAWLNGEFYETAFTAEERDRIVCSVLQNPNNLEYRTPGGIDTQDYVYLLSLDEVGRYFGVDVYDYGTSESLVCMATQSAVNDGAAVLDQAMVESAQQGYDFPLQVGAAVWWLRSPGYKTTYAAAVDYAGCVYRNGVEANIAMVCARPVIRAYLAEAPAKEAPAPDAGPYAVGDVLTYGVYAGEPIEWQILEVREDGTLVLMSVMGLDAMPYHSDGTSVTWEDCTLRAWLNSEFYETAFTAEERGKIVDSTVETPDNKLYGTAGGNTVPDRVYILSMDELTRYFNVYPYSQDPRIKSSEKLICMPAPAATAHRAEVVTRSDIADNSTQYGYSLKAGACSWWLRTPGFSKMEATHIEGTGRAKAGGADVDYPMICIRPVICVRF